MRLVVWLEPEQAADLQRLGVQDPGADEVVGVGVDALEQREAVADQLRLGGRLVHRQRSFEDLLGLLGGTGMKEEKKGVNSKYGGGFLSCENDGLLPKVVETASTFYWLKILKLDHYSDIIAVNCVFFPLFSPVPLLTC